VPGHAGLSQGNDAGAAVGRICGASDEAVAFELVEQSDEARLVVPDRLGESQLGAGGLVREVRDGDVGPHRDLPSIAREGVALSRGWWEMPGAIGVVLYLDLFTKTGGALSIWANEDDLRRFVALPRYVAIMRRYRDGVRVRATTWTTENFSVAQAWEQRNERLAAAGTPGAGV
jgi:hypothetical protein